MEIEKKAPVEEEWPDVVGDTESREEYSRISEAVGELTSSILDCKMKGLLVPDIAEDLSAFVEIVLVILANQIEK